MERVKIGIIGAGRIGRIHATNLVSFPNAKVKAISDIHINHARPWIEELGIPIATDNNADILLDPEIDAIFICSSTDTHIELIKQAATAGKHIFCEKPISLNIEQTLQAIEVVKEAGIIFQAGFNRRFDLNFLRVRESVMAGKIGEPHIVKVTSRDPEPPSYDYIMKSGGLFIDMSIHDFDMARYLSGYNVEEVFVNGAVLVDPEIGKIGDIDTAIIMLRFSNGSLGVIDNSRKAVYGYDQRVEVFGSKGSITAENDFPNSVEWSTEDGVYKDKPKYFFLERYEESYKTEARAFIHAILNEEEATVNENDGFQAELIAYAALQSLQTGKPIKISDVLLSLTKEI